MYHLWLESAMKCRKWRYIYDYDLNRGTLSSFYLFSVLIYIPFPSLLFLYLFPSSTTSSSYELSDSNFLLIFLIFRSFITIIVSVTRIQYINCIFLLFKFRRWSPSFVFSIKCIFRMLIYYAPCWHVNCVINELIKNLYNWASPIISFSWSLL